MVHSLIKSLDLVDDYDGLQQGQDSDDEPDTQDGESDGVDDSHSTKQQQEQEKGRVNGNSNGNKKGLSAAEPGYEVNGDKDYRRAVIVGPDERLGTKECLLKYHDTAYVEALLNHRGSSPPARNPTNPASPSSSSKETQPRRYPRTDPFNLSHDNPPFPSLPRYISYVASATSTACRLLVKDKVDIALCWDGGRHHAKRKEAGGFCYVNDLVMGCLLLSREGRIPVPQKEGEEATRQRTRPPRILYLDLDLHYSDGVSSAFASPTRYPYPLQKGKAVPRPPSVLTLSVHHSSPIFFPPPSPPSLLPEPDTPNPFSLSLPLAAYPSASTYKGVWQDCIEPIGQAWDPDFVVLQLGVDGLPGDRVGQYGNWAVEGEGGMKWCVSQLMKWDKKTCITGGGGYHHANAARAWAGVTASLLGRETDSDTAIPHHDHFEAYEPSFTMEVPAGHMRDENTAKDLDKARDVYKTISQRINDIVAAHS
ncbi:hypothetical protein I316_05316 [Kwoniella heveanensis BCC8398]|uniref:Histone deacetylase domain-containing protein n=1 Tax=Kwoniella heveanensis BCC8398 TaxID=1296120 RepID=A0A1B9GPR1_9TREE|nr:hypothetical protein I316_05316 [Kwoniella heveanensis BCC8398]